MWLLDLGNTALKAAWWADGRLQGRQHVLHGDSVGELGAGLAQLLPRHPGAPVRFCSVVRAPLRQVLVDALEHAGCPWSEAQSQPEAQGLRNGYQDYRQLGADRWLAMLGAWHEYGTALAVVDAGSAVTIDLVDADGCHLGGYILPGRDAMAHGLRGRTGLAFDNTATASIAPGVTTQQAIDHGLTAATVGAVQSCLRAAPIKLRHTLLTGGGAHSLAPLLAGTEVDRDLVFRGLVL